MIDNYNTNDLGLDYGAGTASVITSLLEKEGYDEFKSLINMLNSKGSVFCMTSLYDEDINF